VPGLGTSFGFGAASNHPRDLANSDCILVMGSNMAESHPVGFHWPVQAQQRGAVLMHVDPRYTRTSAVADVFVKIRAGTDIAFLGGIIRYILEGERYFKEYVVHYTNAATLVADEYRHEEEAGLFAGFNPATGSYDLTPGAWEYVSELRPDGTPGLPRTDPTLQDPMCVLQVLKRHYARYTPQAVSQVCGCRPEDVIKVAELLCRNSGRERTSAMAYALGWTQHSTGAQMIRAAAIIQLLLGNVGRPGGGILALRGHACIQGATDIPVLFDMLPGYLPQPRAVPGHATLAQYLANGKSYLTRRGDVPSGLWKEDAVRGAWSDMPKFTISLLKAWYGEAATQDNDYRYEWLPKIDEDLSEMSYFLKMHQGNIRGTFLMGQNPAAGGPNARLHRDALRRLDWLVVRDFFETESASFWYAGPEVTDPKAIPTEVFLLPAASAVEKDGSFTNTERMIQWHDRAVPPPGDCRSDAWFAYDLGKRLKELYRDSPLERDASLRHLTWNYDGADLRIEGEPDTEKVLREINGYHLGERRQLRGPAELASDGSTACGCWLYCGIFPEERTNRARSKGNQLRGTSVYGDWSWTWPENRRILYNRASADPQGRPWSERKKLVWWDEAAQRWTGHDVADFENDKAPGYSPPADAQGMAAIAGDAPFRMHSDGRGWLYVPYGLKDGPLPVFYEPLESPFLNTLVRQQSDPLTVVPADPMNPTAAPGDPAYPLIATTYRLTEHYLSGPMSRFDSWLCELQPEMFVEISPELAGERGVANGDWVVVSSPRGEIEARALVTHRLKPVIVDGRPAHTVGMPIHWGYAGETVGAIVNDLSPLSLDPNADIHGAKSFVCQLRAGRLQHVRPPIPLPVAPIPTTADPIPDTPTAAQPAGRFRHGK
jgi:formate dehydrogenase major subunit